MLWLSTLKDGKGSSEAAERVELPSSQLLKAKEEDEARAADGFI